MQKKLLAVAVAGAFAAPGVALAQASNVQIYGVIDMSYMNYRLTDSAVQKATPGLGNPSAVSKSVTYNAASRWGLRGTEDLGNGLRAFFQLEAGVFPDARPDPNASPNGVGFLGGRNSGIGLQSNTWGQVLIGMWDTPYKQAQYATWVVGGSGATGGHFGLIMNNGDTTGTMPSPACAGGAAAAVTNCGTDAEGNATSFHRRQSNVIQYWSPVWSGFQVKFATAAKEFNGASSTNPSQVATPSMWSSSLTWSGGPFAAGISYEQHRGFGAVSSAGVGSTTNNNAKDTGIMIGGKWTFGMGSIGAGWERLKYGDTIAGAAALSGTGYTLKNWVINGDLKIGGNGRLWAGYSKTPGRSSCGTSYNAGGANDGLCGGATKASYFTLGYDHSLSKRTALYAAYGKINNGDGRSSAGAGVGSSYYYIAGPAGNAANGTGGIAAGSDVTSYAVGVKHTF